MRPLLKSIAVLIALSHYHIITFGQVLPTPGDERLKNSMIRKALEDKSMINYVKFKNIGPNIMSGRVVDLEVNPNDPTEFYVAYATGGLWHTTNNGQSFVPIMDSLDVLFIGDIAVNWTNMNIEERTIWVGTGEVNSSRSSYAGVGMYKTIDNGGHWKYIGLPESHHIGKVQLHPTNPEIAWVAVLGHLYSPNKERGVYKTTDGGKSWKQTLFIDDNTGAVDIDINPSNPSELYAAMWYRTRRAWKFEESGKTSGIYKSADGGETWKLVSGLGSGFMNGEKIGRIGVAVSASKPNVIYAVVDNNMLRPDTAKKDTFYKRTDFKNISKEQFEALKTNLIDTFLKKNGFPRKYTGKLVKEGVATGKYKPTVLWDWLDLDDGFQDAGIVGCEVYRSDDGGRSWNKMNKKGINIYSTYGYYFGKIFVSPANENKVLITGVSLLLSTDSAKTFKTIDEQGNVHGDHHAIWINPRRDSHIINGNDGGSNITYDNGDHWFYANTPAVGQFYSVVTDDDKPYNVYGGLQDNQVWVGPSNYKENSGWQYTGDYPYKFLVGGDGMQVQVDTRDNATTYAGSQFGFYTRLNRKTKIDRRSIRPVHELGETPLRYNWQTPILLSKHNQDVFYFGANRLDRSLNRGDTMIVITGDLTNGKVTGNVPYGTMTTLSESPLRFGTIYIGTDDGNIYVSKDNGYAWTKINVNIPAPAKKGKAPVNTVPSGLWVSRVIASKYKDSRVYASLSGYRSDNFGSYLYMSDDYGVTWKQLGMDLPAEPLNVVREDPKSDSIIYVGTDGGLYVSFDQGNSFMMWNGGLPKSVPVHDIAIQQRENEIILGTHGRSLYVAKLDDVQAQRKDAEWIKKKMEKEKHTPAPAANVDDD
jgi:photosystem II stability/assembly factor-like uncharacterized protein